MTRQPAFSDNAESLADRVSDLFTQAYKGEPSFVVVAPGRVNVIGEHVDYNGGWVLPAAIDRYLVMAVRARKDRIVRLGSANFEGFLEFSLDKLSPEGPRDWGRYVRGVLAGLQEQGFDVPGFDAFLDSTIPVGGGLSSSAALEAATGLAALTLCGGTMDRFALAKLCQKAEHDYAGVPCGIMDQAAILNCQRGNLLFLDCETETFRQAPFDSAEWRLMIINSGVAHELAGGEYAKRRKACHDAAEILGVSSLRHIPLADLDKVLKHPGLDEEMVRCVRHNVTENDRTHRAVAALAAGNVQLAGRLLNASHASLRDDYRVSCEELDFIADNAQKQMSVAGCRMTGGGFGGSCIALVHKDGAAAVAGEITDAFTQRFGHRPAVFMTPPEMGAQVKILRG